uniref:Uncharacterized protein n=1 Tax=Anopheles albimanus TaxID=7167 RepID=A0A8W7K7E0_ANOAL
MSRRRKPFGNNSKRRRTDDISDPSSDLDEDHILVRFKRYFRLLVIIRAIQDKTGLPYLLSGGASTVQDVNGSRNLQACHVLRVGEVNPQLQIDNEGLYNALINFVGHTQIAPSELNHFHGIGGEIDRFQSNNLNSLNRMVYGAGGYGTFVKERLQEMLTEMLAIATRYPEHAAEAEEWIVNSMEEPGLT